MRKFLISVLVALTSVSAFATDWTGTPAGIKVVYYPAGVNSGASIALLQTASTCYAGSAALGNVMTIGEGFEGRTAADIKAFYDFMLQAKASGANITLSYTPGTTCNIQSWTRN